MATANPYAPPTAHVSDVDTGDDATQPLKYTTYKGRIGRLRYLAWMSGGYFLVVFAAAIGGALGALTHARGIVDAVAGIASIVLFLFMVFWTIQRSHDMGWSGWTWLWTLVPLVVLIWIFKGGTKGRNDFGAPPPPNTVGVYILASLLPFIFVLGVLAAIAIPAYSDYAKRAKAMQVQR